jgi:hypothetical protein
LASEGRSKHFTQEFEAFALTLMREMPVKRAGQILGESETRLWQMFLCPSEGGVCAIELRERGVGGDQMNRRKDHNALLRCR